MLILPPWLRLRPFARPAKRVLLQACCSVAALAVVSAASWRWTAARQLTVEQVEVSRLQRELQVAQSAASTASSPIPDFAEQLSDAAATEAVVMQLQRSSAALGVAFASVAINEIAPTEQTLGRMRLSVTLRGTYPNTKTVLAEAFDRYASLLLEHLTIRRVASPTDIEARADLLLATRPRPASAPSGT